ncbi:MAG: L-lactate permease [Chloroflexi bacterium]|nr:L-lactate permease [Chloroflexota bacterium]MBL7163229.1 L-lactate permease [Anaerolineales bacterium]
MLNKVTSSSQQKGNQSHSSDTKKKLPPELGSALASYGLLTALMTVIAVVKPINNILADFAWSASFPQVTSLTGFITAPGTGQVIRPLVHPGTAMLFIAIVSILVNQKMGLIQNVDYKSVLIKTWKSAKPATIGIISMVGLSTLMDHTGMTLLLAEGFSNLFGRVFPIISPLVGMLGAFATGSNNNSNVLLASLQENVAHILKLSPTILIAAQTAGGSLGSMIAPAKLFVGCSTVGLFNRDGDVLRITLSYGLVIGVGLGLVTLIFSL